MSEYLLLEGLNIVFVYKLVDQGPNYTGIVLVFEFFELEWGALDYLLVS